MRPLKITACLLVIFVSWFNTGAQQPSPYQIHRSVVSSIPGTARLRGQGYQVIGIAGQPVVAISSGPGAYSVRNGYPNTAVSNSAPVITSITAPIDPVNIADQSPVVVSVGFTDANLKDDHRVTWQWGDGAMDTLSNLTSPASHSHIYSMTGVYQVGVTVADDHGGQVSSFYQFIVIYDPNGGFVTGGGWIMSPAGAYKADPTLTGKAAFGFVSKYKKGASLPDGSTEFQFQAGSLNFHSTSYDWLVINQAGLRAQFKGWGTVNGVAGYRFMLWAVDGSPDTFRIKIWRESDGMVIYDNRLGADDNNFGQPISGGNIVVHKPK